MLSFVYSLRLPFLLCRHPSPTPLSPANPRSSEFSRHPSAANPTTAPVLLSALRLLLQAGEKAGRQTVGTAVDGAAVDGVANEEGTDAGSGVFEAAVVVRYERLVSGSAFLALPTVPTPLCLPGHCLPCQHTHPTNPCMRRSSVHPPQLPAVSPTPFSPTPCARLTNALFTNTVRPSHQRPFHQHHAPVSPTPFSPTPCARLTNAFFPCPPPCFSVCPLPALLPTSHSSDPFITSSAFDVVTPGGVVSGVCHGLPAMEGLHSWQVELACRMEGRGGAGGRENSFLPRSSMGDACDARRDSESSSGRAVWWAGHGMMAARVHYNKVLTQDILLALAAYTRFSNARDYPPCPLPCAFQLAAAHFYNSIAPCPAALHSTPPSFLCRPPLAIHSVDEPSQLLSIPAPPHLSSSPSQLLPISAPHLSSSSTHHHPPICFHTDPAEQHHLDSHSQLFPRLTSLSIITHYHFLFIRQRTTCASGRPAGGREGQRRGGGNTGDMEGLRGDGGKKMARVQEREVYEAGCRGSLLCSLSPHSSPNPPPLPPSPLHASFQRLFPTPLAHTTPPHLLPPSSLLPLSPTPFPHSFSSPLSPTSFPHAFSSPPSPPPPLSPTHFAHPIPPPTPFPHAFSSPLSPTSFPHAFSSPLSPPPTPFPHAFCSPLSPTHPFPPHNFLTPLPVQEDADLRMKGALAPPILHPDCHPHLSSPVSSIHPLPSLHPHIDQQALISTLRSVVQAQSQHRQR
ncbi:unnamed protein product [Closterium sp. NIES-64]|nr:unnamed protein product [Closterium sp. NIES-64]